MMVYTPSPCVLCVLAQPTAWLRYATQDKSEKSLGECVERLGALPRIGFHVRETGMEESSPILHDSHLKGAARVRSSAQQSVLLLWNGSIYTDLKESGSISSVWRERVKIFRNSSGTLKILVAHRKCSVSASAFGIPKFKPREACAHHHHAIHSLQIGYAGNLAQFTCRCRQRRPVRRRNRTGASRVPLSPLLE